MIRGRSALLLAGMVGVAASQPALAKSGADLLLKSFKGKAPKVEAPREVVEAPKLQDAGLSSVDQFKLNDPLSVQFFTAWNESRSKLTPEVSFWAAQFLKGDYEQAMHLWESVDSKIPSSFRAAANAARLASLVRMGLTQTAIEEWVDLVGSSSAANADAWVSILETMIPRWISASYSGGVEDPSATWDKVLLDRGVILNAELENEVMRLDPRKRLSIVSLQAYASLRKGEQGKKLLGMLRMDNRLKLPLAQTVALAQARRGDLASAATTLKEHAEPALETQKDYVKASSYLLQIARFLFQAGMWDESESYLRKIPTSAPEFVGSREELAWILLRKGDVSQLRGEIASLSTEAAEARFQPELPVVRAISNLKLCSYGAVQKDFDQFSKRYGAWATQIDQALTARETPAPVTPDAFTSLAELRVNALNSELSKITELHTRSLKTGTPSVVGRQGQWKKLEVRMASRQELAKKLLSNEYRRQWRNQKTLLGEAIRKMRFVKVELLHQMHIAANDERKGMDVVPTTQGAALQTTGNDQIVFPMDGVIWPDELFQLQSQVESRCLRAQKGEAK